MPKRLIGYYAATHYTIEDFDTQEELYLAGNSPMESQVYVDAADGVGLETMKKYCEITGKDMAAEIGAEFIGAEQTEDMGDG